MRTREYNTGEGCIIGFVIAVIRKEFLVYSRRRLLYVNLLALPIILALLVSAAFENLLGSPGRIPLPVVDLDRSTASATLVGALRQDHELRVTLDSSRDTFTDDDAADRIDRGRRPAVLVIPAGYGGAVDRGEAINMRLYTDPAQSAITKLVRTAVQAGVERVTLTEASIRAASAQTSSGGDTVRAAVSDGVDAFLTAPPLQVSPVSSREGRGLPSAFEQTIPGFAVLFSVNLGQIIYVLTIDERREWGVGGRLHGMHAPRWAHIAGKLAVGYAAGLLQFALLLTLAHLIFGMEIGSPALLAIVVAAYVPIPLAIGSLVAAFINNVHLGTLLVSGVGTVVAIVGGALVPTFLLPHVLVVIAKGSPFYWALNGMQSVMVRGAGLEDVLPNIAILLGTAATMLAIALPAFSYKQRGAK